MGASLDLFEVIDCLEFFGEIARVMLCVEFTTGIFQQNGGLIQACVAVDMLREPRLDICEISARETFGQIAEILFHRREHLRAVRASERVGGEIAEAAARPMCILQTALGVAGNVHAEIFLVKAIPFAGQIADGKRTADEPLFQLVTNHNV